jgi:hypothetical protein
MNTNEFKCEICGNTEMAVLYWTISDKRACNPCTDNENNKWLGETHFEYLTKEELFDQDDLLIS